MRAQFGQPRNQLPRVVGIAALSAVPRIIKQRFAGFAISKVSQVRLLRRVLQRDKPAFLAAPIGSLCGRGQLRRAVAGQSRCIAREIRSCFGRVQQLVNKRRLQRRILFVDLLQLFLVGIGEVCAGMNELVVGVVHQLERFSVEVQRLAQVVDRLDPRKKLRVQINRIVQCSLPRSLVLLHFLQSRIGVCGGDAVEDAHYAIQQLARLLERNQRVLKCGRRGIVGDGAHFVALLCHAGIDGRLIVAVFDFVEWRRVKRKRAWRVEGILRS